MASPSAKEQQRILVLNDEAFRFAVEGMWVVHGKLVCLA